MEKQNHKRNPLFDLLVKEKDDIEGLVAYGLYKRHKRLWAHRHRTSNDCEPSQDSEREFASVAATDDQLERYRKDAQDMLVEFAEAFVNDAEPGIARGAVVGRIDEAVQKMEASASFPSLLRVGVTSTLVTSAFVALLAFGAQYFGIDLVDAVVSHQNPP